MGEGNLGKGGEWDRVSGRSKVGWSRTVCTPTRWRCAAAKGVRDTSSDGPGWGFFATVACVPVVAPPSPLLLGLSSSSSSGCAAAAVDGPGGYRPLLLRVQVLRRFMWLVPRCLCLLTLAPGPALEGIPWVGMCRNWGWPDPGGLGLPPSVPPARLG